MKEQLKSLKEQIKSTTVQLKKVDATTNHLHDLLQHMYDTGAANEAMDPLMNCIEHLVSRRLDLVQALSEYKVALSTATH